MLDIGGWELMLVAIIAIIVVGPKDLPGLIRTVSQWVRRARGLVDEFRSGLDEIARESELESIRSDIDSAIGAQAVRNRIDDMVDPTGEVSAALDVSAPHDEDGVSPPDKASTPGKTDE